MVDHCWVGLSGHEPAFSVGRGRNGYLTVLFAIFASLSAVGVIAGVASLSLALSVVFAFFLLFSTVIWRASGRSARVSADRMRIHNLLRTYNLGRSDIAEFFIDDVRVGGAGGRYQTVYARCTDGRELALEACARSPLLDRKADQRLIDDLQALSSWLLQREVG